jgi:hypothetical protein
MKNLGKQCQRDHSSDDEESTPYGLRQPPKGVPENGHREARGALSGDGRAGWARYRLAGSWQKGVRIALGQELERTLLDFGTDEDEFGVQLPRLDLRIRGRLTFGEKAFFGRKGRPRVRDDPKPVLEIERGLKGDSCHTASGYRRQASLT